MALTVTQVESSDGAIIKIVFRGDDPIIQNYDGRFMPQLGSGFVFSYACFASDQSGVDAGSDAFAWVLVSEGVHFPVEIYALGDSAVFQPIENTNITGLEVFIPSQGIEAGSNSYVTPYVFMGGPHWDYYGEICYNRVGD